MMSLSIDRLEEYARSLEASEDFRVLRRLRQEPPEQRSLKEGERVAVILDTETTGLDPRRDEVIELAMISVAYDQNGRITQVLGQLQALREPDVPISPESTRITGISPEMLRGKKLPKSEVDDFLAPAAVIIAHNAAFDRPMCEKLSETFASKSWACSATQIDWGSLGFEGRKLVYLLYQFGLFHHGHRAMDDAQATLQILKRPIPKTGEPALPSLLSVARTPTVRYWVQSFPELASALRKRGYKWNPTSRKHPRSWTIEVAERQAIQEDLFVREHARSVKNVAKKWITAADRFKLDE